MEISIIIDSLTNCLVARSTGEEFDTEYKKIDKQISSKDAKALKKAGWKFDWSIPQKDGCEIYKLTLKDDETLQGLIAIKHIPEQYYTKVELVESAPFNIGENGKYKGVGGHLFAVACKLSWDAGNEGYVQFIAKTALIDHYVETVHANIIDGNNLFIDTYGALALIEKYIKEV